MPSSFAEKWSGPTLKFDRTSLVATAIFIAFAFGYNHYMKTKYPHLNTTTEPTSPQPSPLLPKAPQSPPIPAASSPALQPPPPPAQATLPASSRFSEEDLTFESSTSRWVVDARSGGFAKIELKDYRTSAAEDAPWVNLVEESLWLQPLLSGEMLHQRSWDVEKTPGSSSVTLKRTAQDIAISQTFSFPDEGYAVDWRVRYRNLGDETTELHAIVAMEDALLPLEQSATFLLPGFPMGRPSLVATTEKGTSHEDSEQACEDEEAVAQSSPASFVKLVGLDSFYFIKAILPQGAESNSAGAVRGYYSLQKRALGAGRGCRFAAYLGQNFGFLPPGAEVEVPFTLFFGPKEYRITRQYSDDLTETIDLGWLSFLSLPLLYMLHLFFDWVGNYGLAIILLTLMIKILFYPLTKSSALSMHKNRKLQPQIKEIRQRYSKDPRKQQQELMALMSRHGTNPFKGCLPILLQMPVFFALYRVLSTAVELRHAPFFGWIQDLSAADPYFITPILMAGFMMLQQKISAPQIAMDEMQQKIIKWLPLIFALMMIGFPAGMVLYMLVNTITSIIQQYYLNRRFGLTK